MSIILGIDPGSRTTGYGVISTKNSGLAYIASGCINAQTGNMPERLAKIFTACKQLIDTYQPSVMAIEKAFLAKNPHVAIVLGQARGVAMVAASSQAIDVHEYAPRLIKKAVTGNGNAHKQQVQHMISVILNLPRIVQTDAADALAVAVCHSYYLGTISKYAHKTAT